jgi:hypothetical protein
MRHGIVEGEPGIFPAPIARLFQAIGRLFGRRTGDARTSDSTPAPGPTDVSDLDPVRPDAPDDTGR